MTDSETPIPSARIRHPLRRAAIAVIVAVVLIGLLQWSAPHTDHQHANFASCVATVLFVGYILLQFHRWALLRGHRWIVPAGTLVVFGTAIVLFRFDGFSGELMPQFTFRFGSHLQRRGLSHDVPPGSPLSSAAAVAEADSLGFLGNDRNGVVNLRSFAVPSNPQEVETLWNQGIGEGWSSFAVSGDLAVTLEQRDQTESVSCYRLGDGQLLWLASHQAVHRNTLGGVGPRSTPTIHDNRVYAQGATGHVWCLNLETGKVIWELDLLELAGWDQLASEVAIAWGRAGSPLLVDGMCIVPFGGPEQKANTGRSLIALDANDGSTVWTAGEGQISYASPTLMTLAGVRQIVSVNEATITGHDVGDGKELWSFPWPGQSNAGANCSTAIAAGENRFLIGKGYSGGSALVEVKASGDMTFTAEPVWASTRVLKTKFTHVCVEDNVAYAISNGWLEAVDIEQPKQLWNQPRRDRFGQGHILLVGDTIVAQDETGEVVFVAADRSEYRELLRLPAMDSKTWNIPTVAGRHLLVRNDRQAICFLLPEK